MVNPVQIELNVEDVKKKSLDQKVDVLIDIAFANHTLLGDHGLIIFGNGDPTKGLCFKVNTQATRLNWLIGILSAVGLTGLAGFVSYLAGK